MTTTTHPNRQRITASAREAGLAACEFDRPLVCRKCGRYGPCHTYWAHLGGAPDVQVIECHDWAGCEQRRGNLL